MPQLNRRERRLSHVCRNWFSEKVRMKVPPEWAGFLLLLLRERSLADSSRAL